MVGDQTDSINCGVGSSQEPTATRVEKQQDDGAKPNGRGLMGQVGGDNRSHAGEIGSAWPPHTSLSAAWSCLPGAYRNRMAITHELTKGDKSLIFTASVRDSQIAADFGCAP